MTLKYKVSAVGIVVSLATLAPALAAPPEHAAAVGRARELMAEHPGRVHLAAGDEFSAGDVVFDPDGGEHVRFQRSFRGRPVVGGDLVVHSEHGRLWRVSQTLASSRRPDGAPALSPPVASAAAAEAFDGGVGVVQNQGLVLWARGAEPVLAYQVQIHGQAEVMEKLYFIDATDGRLLDVQSQVQTAATVGNGRTLLHGDVALTTDSLRKQGYRLVDPSRGDGSVLDAWNQHYSLAHRRASLFTDADNTWGNGVDLDRASVAGDIHFGVSATWDYFLSAHGRRGIFDTGAGVKSYAHVNFGAMGGPNGGQNAAWYRNAMYFGDGDPHYGVGPYAALDVAAHEMSHGVNGATAGLLYSGDAGGLNEANSDIFGTMVEFFADHPLDPGDYVIGERLLFDNPDDTFGLRLMFAQHEDGRSFSCYPAGGFDPSLAQTTHNAHYTSGVANRFFYLLAEGAVVPANFAQIYRPADLVCNGNTGLKGIGRDLAAAIWYRALTTGFTSSTSYPGARSATLQAAAELFGPGSVEALAVAAAWSAVDVR